MPYALKLNQTTRPLLFLMVQSTDHVSPLTGATPTVLLSKNGAAFASPAGAVSEVGHGWYKVAGNATDQNTLGLLVLTATATGGDPSDVEFTIVAYDPENDVTSIKAKTDTLGAGSVRVVSPVTPSGAVTLYAGYDMLAENGLSIDFADPGNWPDLTGASVKLVGKWLSAFTLNGVVLGAGGPGQVVRFEPTAASTAGIVQNDNYVYDVYAILTDGDLVPLVIHGSLAVKVKLA